VKRALNHNDIIDFRLKSFEYNIKLPSTTTALVDNKLCACLEGSQWLKAHLEDKGIVRAHKTVVSLLKEH